MKSKKVEKNQFLLQNFIVVVWGEKVWEKRYTGNRKLITLSHTEYVYDE